MRKNHLGQYVSTSGRFVAVLRFVDGGHDGYYVHDLETGKRRKAKNLKEVQEIVNKVEK